MKDCRACRLFDLETAEVDCFHFNRPGGLTLTRQALNSANLAPGSGVLDIACGMGSTLNYLTRELELNTVGLDLSRDMLDRNRTSYPGLSLIQADGGAIPLASESFDAVVTECALSLTGQTSAIIDDSHRLLRRGGKLIASDIYVREILDSSAMDFFSNSPCLAGAVSAESIKDMIRRRGFTLCYWQDCTDELKRWMARMVFKLGSINAFYKELLSCRNDLGAFGTDFNSKIKLGYYLLVAEKIRVV